MPEVYKQFMATIKRMENYFHDMQDMEYTIEKGTLYFLQTRNGKRTARAALKIACDLVDEGLIDEQEAVLRVEPKQLNDLLHPTFDEADLKKPMTPSSMVSQPPQALALVPSSSPLKNAKNGMMLARRSSLSVPKLPQKTSSVWSTPKPSSPLVVV